MGSIWGRQDPSGPHVVPMNFADVYFNAYMCMQTISEMSEIKISEIRITERKCVDIKIVIKSLSLH